MIENTIIHGDCFEIMRQIPSESVDMVLTDPPYGTTRNAWDKSIDLCTFWEEIKRICKRNAAIVIFSQQPFTTEMIASNRKQFRYEWIYVKNQGTGFLNSHKMPLKIHENILVFYERLPKYHPQMTHGNKPYISKQKNKHRSTNYGYANPCVTFSDGERYPVDVIRYAQERGMHPTQKPVALCEYLIRTYTDAGDIVLDPFVGSGTTGVACVNTGREIIGIEKDDAYYQIAYQRVEDAKNRAQNE